MLRTVLVLAMAAAMAKGQNSLVEWHEGFDGYNPGVLTTQSAWELVTVDSPWTDEDLEVKGTVRQGAPFSPGLQVQIDDGATVLYSFTNNPIPGMKAAPTSGRWVVSGRFFVYRQNAKGSARLRLLDDADPSDPKIGGALVLDGSRDAVFLDTDFNVQLPLPKEVWTSFELFVDLDAGTVTAYVGGQLLKRDHAWFGKTRVLDGLWIYGGNEGGSTVGYLMDDLRVHGIDGTAELQFNVDPNPVPVGTSTLNMAVNSKGYVGNGVNAPAAVLFWVGADDVPMPWAPIAFFGLSLDGAGADQWPVNVPPGVSGLSIQVRLFAAGLGAVPSHAFSNIETIQLR